MELIGGMSQLRLLLLRTAATQTLVSAAAADSTQQQLPLERMALESNATAAAHTQQCIQPLRDVSVSYTTVLAAKN